MAKGLAPTVEENRRAHREGRILRLGQLAEAFDQLASAHEALTDEIQAASSSRGGKGSRAELHNQAATIWKAREEALALLCEEIERD